MADKSGDADFGKKIQEYKLQMEELEKTTLEKSMASEHKYLDDDSGPVEEL